MGRCSLGSPLKSKNHSEKIFKAVYSYENNASTYNNPASAVYLTLKYLRRTCRDLSSTPSHDNFFKWKRNSSWFFFLLFHTESKTETKLLKTPRRREKGSNILNIFFSKDLWVAIKYCQLMQTWDLTNLNFKPTKHFCSDNKSNAAAFSVTLTQGR